jgi:Zn-dependent peptidase ImmA (M78 family)
LSAARKLTGSIAANIVHKWLRAWYAADIPEAIDLDVVRQMLPTTPYGTGVREIKPPMPIDISGFEGSLVRHPHDAAEWGILYNGSASPERRRFTVAHELGHFILHRNTQSRFNCDKESVYSGHETMRLIEREADDFAGNLLMPGDRLREWISNQRIDLHVLGAIAKRFKVSFEALCIRFIKFTPQRAILVYWDNGYVKYEWRSSSAIKTRARIRRNADPQEPLPGTLAADASVDQEWDGTEMSAAMWCPEEAPHMKLREFKHSYTARDRVLTLLLLESAEPRAWDQSWRDGDNLYEPDWQ